MTDIVAQEHSYPRMAFLSDALDCPVYRVPDGHGTCSDGESIWIEKRFLDLIGTTPAKARRAVGLRPWRRAQALYFLLHEHGHVLQHRRGHNLTPTPNIEIDANRHAAAFFRNFLAGRLGLSGDDAGRLYRSLPDYYREPENV